LPPFGQEYMRSHRAYRQLAMLLTKQGFPVMRFDYKGTGDSSGYVEEATLEGWLNDISVAVEELKGTAGVEKVHVVGLRLGALLASAACAEKITVGKLVLWDPIISGKAYDTELKNEIALADSPACNYVDDKGTLHFNGFPLVKSLRSELSTLDLMEISPKVDQILHVVSQETASSKHLKEAWGEGSNYCYELAPAPGNWNYVDEYGGFLLPQPVIQAIVNWMIS